MPDMLSWFWWFVLFFAGATAYRYGRFGRGNGSIYLDNLNCYGSESRLIDCYHNGIGIHNCDHSDDASLRCQRKCFNCHCIKTFVEGCGKIFKLCAERLASFPGSHALECEHWSCAGVKSLVFFLTWEAVKDRRKVDATLIVHGQMSLRTEKGMKVAGNLLHVSSYRALNIIHTERWNIVGWTTRKTLPFCFVPILITSCLRRKDTRLSVQYILAFQESLGTRLQNDWVWDTSLQYHIVTVWEHLWNKVSVYTEGPRVSFSGQKFLVCQKHIKFSPMLFIPEFVSKEKTNFFSKAATKPSSYICISDLVKYNLCHFLCQQL